MNWRTLGLCAVFLLAAGGAIAKTVTVETIEIKPSEAAGAPAGGVDSLPIPALPGHDVEPDEKETEPDSDTTAQPVDPAGPPPQVYYDRSSLPKPVARMHAQMREAALSGDVERMRMILESNEVMPTLSLTPIGDPIDFLKASSGDGEGYEILAILADTLDAGFIHVDAGTPQEMYVWPYFARYPFDQLTPDQKVEMFRIVTSSDFADMEQYGTWTFYRVGIGPDGTLHYFVAGD